MSMYDIITAGSATMDAFVKTDSELIKIKTKEGEEDLIAYPAGSKILIKQLDFMTGGCATNTAVAFARLGLKTGCISNIGKDDNAKKILEELKKEKIDFLGTIEEGMTSYSIILDSIEHQRTILTYKALSNKLKYSKLKTGRFKTKWFYFATMLEESYKTLEKLAEFAEKNKIKVAFNPTSYLAKKGPKFLNNILKRTEALVLNKEEAQLLLGNDPTKYVHENILLKKLIMLGPKIVVMTAGSEGAYAYDGKIMYYIRPNPVKIAETTGAGDAFTSSFVAGLIKAKPVEFCLRLAQTNAESVIQNYGAKNILLSWSKALTRMSKHKHTVSKKKI